MSKQKGFTTIELLIVIAVIAVLAAGIIAAVQRARVQAQDGEIKKKLAELEGTQSTIKSEGGEYKAYDSGSLQDSRLQEISDAIKQINGVGFDDDDLIGANDTGYGVVTPTVTENGVFCFSSREQGVRRLSNGYDDGLDYAQALENPGSGPAWDCPSVSFTPDANPENITASNLETSYARLTEAKESQVYDPQNYNKEIKIKLTSSEGGEICKAETGTACTSGWTNSIEVSPDPVADNFKLRNPTVNSPGKTKHDLEITEISGDGSTDTKWILKSDYTSCQEAQNIGGYSTTATDYAIDPSGKGDDSSSIRVLCNMDIDGGGWTLIASYVDGSYFNTCDGSVDGVDMQYGGSCRISCDYFADDSSTSNSAHHCDDPGEQQDQNDELAKLETKYIIDSGEASGFRDLTQYESTDYVSEAYHSVAFEESMFADDHNDFGGGADSDWITYDFADNSTYVQGSSGNTNSMRDFYETMSRGHMETIVEYKNSNMDPGVVNNCDNFDLVLNAADHDGRNTLDYLNSSVDLGYKYWGWSAAAAGPQWDSGRNGGCRYDDISGQWQNTHLGSQPDYTHPTNSSLNFTSPQNNSDYILWYVR